jgi:hypothetical protein
MKSAPLPAARPPHPSVWSGCKDGTWITTGLFEIASPNVSSEAVKEEIDEYGL